MVRRGLVRSRSEAQHLIEAGRVAVAGIEHPKPASSVGLTTAIELAPGERFASRAGEKLASALDLFQISVADKRTIDVGSSAGGFVDCLLQRGAIQVVAVDVGKDQLRPELRLDPRVNSFEGLDIRQATPEQLGGPFETVVADLSFVSLCSVATHLAGLALPDADVIALVKPQFEVGKDLVGRGVVLDKELRESAVEKVIHCFEAVGLDTVAVMESPITGEHGNHEYLLWARPNSEREEGPKRDERPEKDERPEP
jgi:23S rRNA (cytidine1920-2'-O)/16S rRNA (cytidine1409-2'-O)-methyltransferase